MALKNKVMAVFRRDVAKASEDTQEELNGLHGFYGNKVLSSEDQQIYDNGVRDYEKQLAAAAISPFHDAISNMTLFAEALASNKQNLVVAFGAEHVAPLHELLTEVNGVHKHYNIEDKTSNNDN